MGILSSTADNPAEVSVGFRTGWLKTFKVALAGGGYLAAVIAAFELLGERPQEGFGLLGKWGPWPIIVLVAVCIFGRFLSRLNDTIQVSFTSMVASARDGAQAQARMADAVTQLAEHGGRQGDEVRRLATYAAREFPGLYQRLDRQDEALSEIAGTMREIKGHLRKRGENSD